jgi:metal-sulfur cluster biosynthetic enzyme
MSPPHVTAEAVTAAINAIVDPCSRAAGIPAGLVDMGLIRALDVTGGQDGAVVRVVVGVTEYGCLLGPAFSDEIRRRVAALPGVREVVTELDDRFDWVPEDMSARYRAALARRRAAGRDHFAPGGTPTP